MASKYFDKIKGFTTKGIVMEDSVWPFGQAKEKAKINIPVLLPLQEPAETTKYVKKKSNAGITDRGVEETHNYIELFLPDSVYTFPTDAEVENENCTIHGASKENPKRTEENGETTEGLTRIVKKKTRLMLFIIDGIAIADNIKILGRFDDFEEEPEPQESNFGAEPLTKEAKRAIYERADKKKSRNFIQNFSSDKDYIAWLRNGGRVKISKITKSSATR